MEGQLCRVTGGHDSNTIFSNDVPNCGDERPLTKGPARQILNWGLGSV